MDTLRLMGTGSYLPPRILDNNEFEKMGLATSDEWIVQRTGIRERRIAAPEVTTSDLGYEAACRALETANLAPDQIDLIIVATITPDTCCPSAANWLQAKLQASQAISFDITAACSGFIFALNVAEQYLKNRSCRRVLVVAAEVMSRTLDWRNRSTCILWGDGAGAAVLTMDKVGPQVLSTHLHSDGSQGQDLLLPGGGSKTTPISHDSVDKGIHHLDMIGANMSFRVAVRYFMESIQEAVDHNGLSVGDVDWIIPHQANKRMFEYVAWSMKVPLKRFYLTLHKYGNISSASCAIALDEAVRDGSIKKDQIICLPVFGGGLTWGSALIQW